MTDGKKRGRGKPIGAKRISAAERDMIRAGLAHGMTGEKIAEKLGRGRSTVYKAIQRMEAGGTLHQLLFPFAARIGGEDDSAQP